MRGNNPSAYIFHGSLPERIFRPHFRHPNVENESNNSVLLGFLIVDGYMNMPAQRAPLLQIYTKSHIFNGGDNKRRESRNCRAED